MIWIFSPLLRKERGSNEILGWEGDPIYVLAWKNKEHHAQGQQETTNKQLVWVIATQLVWDNKRKEAHLPTYRKPPWAFRAGIKIELELENLS